MAKKLVNFVKSIIKRVRELHSRIVKDADASSFIKGEARTLAERADDLQAIVDKWEAAVKEGIKNQNAKAALKDNTDSGKVQEQFSIRNTINMSYEDQIEKYYNRNGEIKRNDTLVLLKNTPDVLVEYGIDDLPLALPLSVISKAQSGKDESHSISYKNIKKLKNGIENSIAIVIDKKRKRAFSSLQEG